MEKGGDTEAFLSLKRASINPHCSHGECKKTCGQEGGEDGSGGPGGQQGRAPQHIDFFIYPNKSFFTAQKYKKSSISLSYMLRLFVINTNYICENTEKVVETYNYVYIYHA